MKRNRVIATTAGVLLFLSIVLTTVWLYSTKNTSQPGELALDDVVTKIEKREVKEMSFKQSRVELMDTNNKKFFVNLESDPTREALVSRINKYNEINSSAPIKYTEEPVSSGFGGFGLIAFLPMALFFTMWGLTLAVIVYAVRTLSRNKS